MEQPTTADPNVASAQLAARARSFQHDALAELFDRAFDDVYEFAHALTGDHDTAGEVTESAFRRLLDRLDDVAGDTQTLTAAILALSGEAIRHLPRARFAGRGIRESIARLPGAEHEAITLRLVAGLDHALIAAVTARRPASVLGSEIAALRSLRGPAGSALKFATPPVQRQLDGALERLLDGEPVEQARKAVPALAEAPGLLATAANLVSIPAASAPPEVRARLRNHFLAAAEERRARWVQRHYVPAVVPGYRPRTPAHPITTTAALLLASVLAVIAGGVLAFAANFATPSSAIYPLKRMDENLLLAITFDRVAKANLEVKLSEARMREAETEAATRHGDSAVQALEDRYGLLRAAAADLAPIRHRDTGWKKARDNYFEQATVPIDPLERLLSTNGMKEDADQVARLNEAFQNDRKALDAPLGTPGQAQGGKVPSGAPNATPPPTQ